MNQARGRPLVVCRGGEVRIVARAARRHLDLRVVARQSDTRGAPSVAVDPRQRDEVLQNVLTDGPRYRDGGGGDDAQQSAHGDTPSTERNPKFNESIL